MSDDFQVVYPNKTVRVDFRGPPLEIEKLYSELRPYGQLARLEYSTVKGEDILCQYELLY